MSTLAQRLLIFFIGGPVIVSLAFLDYFDFLALYIATTITAFLCARELHSLLSKKLSVQPKPLFLIASAIVPAITYIIPLFGLSHNVIYVTFIIAILVCFAFEIFNPAHKENFDKVLTNISTTTFSIFYVGLLPTFIIQISYHEHATIFISTFLVMVMACDSLAWFFGMLFGKGNRGFIKVSPNKSIAGYIGGIFGSVIGGVILYYFFSPEFNNNIGAVIFTGIIVALCSILGDLFESALKRACAHKDSDIGGIGIPGRGGFLDSVDSMIFTAPIFLILINFFFK